MQTTHKNLFTTIRTEGGILPADLLQRIASGDSDIKGMTPESYHLAGSEKLNEAINRSWNHLLGVWESFKARVGVNTPSDQPQALTSPTRERWLLPLFQELGYGRLLPSKAVEIEGKDYPISHFWQHTPLHLIGCGLDIDQRTKGAVGAARMSPHGLVQEFLNRSDDHLWAIVTNGLKLRILRDNVSLTRQAYVEFDLETMMDGQVYSDFTVLWLLCHQSRVESELPEQCWMEKWSQFAQEQGTRALEQLRTGVQEAITALGSGFLAHPANTGLKEKLRNGDLDKQDYYRQLLRVVYRALFLFVAEDRDVLLDPGATVEAKERFTNWYSTTRLRNLAAKHRGTDHPDLWQMVRLIFQGLGSDNGCSGLGLPALGSFLWSDAAVPDLINCELRNRDLLTTVRALAITIENNTRRTVDFKNLGSEELGSVYESLLELHPDLNPDAATFELSVAAGHERKTTGSYYTPSSLVNCLLDSALNPVLDEAAKKPDPEKAILDLKVCDPASGSGHFLIAAAHRIGRRLAAARTGDDEPSPDAYRHALRDVIGHCIYGVDINPMAVELCKVSLWLEALEPGRPLSFLDHHIQCGNSLLGTTPKLMKDGIPDDAFKPIEGDDKSLCTTYRKQNKQERRGEQSLFFGTDTKPWAQLSNLAVVMAGIDDIDDSSLDGIKKKKERYETIVMGSGYLFNRLLADAWCAAFVWKKVQCDNLPYAITEEVYRKIEGSPNSCPPWMRDEIQLLADRYQFFHWHLAFPDVFRVPAKGENPENAKTGWKGGFNVVLGNPPWEKLKLQEREFFASCRPDIANASTAAARSRLIAALGNEAPELICAFVEAKRKAEAETQFSRVSGRFPLGAVGDMNTYPLFLENGDATVSERGRLGLIVKTGILADYSTREFFAHLVNNHRIVSAYDFSNKRLIFPGVVANERFTLLTLCGRKTPCKSASISILNDTVSDLNFAERVWLLSPDDVRRINPNTLTCPLFQQARDARLVKDIYRRLSVLLREGEESDRTDWGIDYFSMFHMTNDSGLFTDQEELQKRIGCDAAPMMSEEATLFVPLVEGKLFDQFNHRHGDFKGVPREKRFGIKAEPNHPTERQMAAPHSECLPRYWVPGTEASHRFETRLGFSPNAVLTFRDVCRTHTDLRTVRACVYPAYGFGNKAPLLLFPKCSPEEHAERSLVLCTNFCAYVFDFVARQKFSGGSLNRYILIQLPTIPNVDHSCSWSQDTTLFGWLTILGLELSYTTWDLEPFAKDCGYDGPPFRWDKERRFLLRCELDAAYFHLYGIDREDVDYIMETFPIVKRKDEKAHGTYRTKETILEMYDQMAHATATGEPYQTWLNPPPGPPTYANGNFIPIAQWEAANWPEHIHSPNRNTYGSEPDRTEYLQRCPLDDRSFL